MSAYKKISAITGRVSWFCSFYYTDWQGQRRQKKKEGFATQREAKEYERRFLEKLAITPDILFDDLLSVYLSDLKIRTKATSFNNIASVVNAHIKGAFPGLPLNGITTRHIREWQNKIQQKGLNINTAKGINRRLSAIFNYAVKFYNLTENPARRAGIIKGSEKHLIKIWTPEQFGQFIQEVPAAYKAAFITLYYTGMREAELLALTVEDMEYTTNTIHITKNYHRLHKQDIISTTKTPAGKRRILLPENIMKEIKAEINKAGEMTAGARLFGHMSVIILRYQIKKAAERAGVPAIRVHDLRHSHASFLIDKGFSPIAIKERLGHENIQVTLNTYGHLFENKSREICEALGAAFSGQS